MKQVVLGRTGVRVSELCFGTMSFGGDADEGTSAELYRRCREAGVTFFDCANVYAGGHSEEILGRLIRGTRDELVITSKAGFPTGDGRIPRGLCRRTLRLAVEDSLRRLGTDRIDMYFCHHRDPDTPVEQTLEVLDELVTEGKILYAGVSNWTAWQMAEAVEKASRLGLRGIQVIQPMYNLAKRTAEIEILPYARSAGLGVISYSPLGGGLLTGKYGAGKRQDTNGRISVNRMYRRRYEDDGYFELADSFVTRAAELGVHPVTLAVAWVAGHPAVSCPIIGARNVEQLEPALAAADFEMTEELRSELNSLTPPVPVPTDRDEERAEW